MYSPDETHRYMLSRVWGTAPPLAVIGLNPSTATESVDDPTVRRCLRFARDWGHGGLVMLNLFSLRSTDPRVLKQTLAERCTPDSGPSPAYTPLTASPAYLAPLTGGDLHDRLLLHYTDPQRCGRVLAAWGNHGELIGRGKVVKHLLRDAGRLIECLALTGRSHPVHPLYQPASARPVSFP
jgi:hypothetical protein